MCLSEVRKFVSITELPLCIIVKIEDVCSINREYFLKLCVILPTGGEHTQDFHSITLQFFDFFLSSRQALRHLNAIEFN